MPLEIMMPLKIGGSMNCSPTAPPRQTGSAKRSCERWLTKPKTNVPGFIIRPPCSTKSRSLLTDGAPSPGLLRSAICMAVGPRPVFLTARSGRWINWSAACDGSECLVRLFHALVARNSGQTPPLESVPARQIDAGKVFGFPGWAFPR